MNNCCLAGLSHLSVVGNFRTMLDRKMLNHANLSMKKYERTLASQVLQDIWEN